MKVRKKEKKPELLVNFLFFLPVIEIKIRIYPFMECYSL